LQGSDSVLPDDGISHQNMQELFSVNFNANLKLFLRLYNCASVGEKNLIIIKMHGMYVKIIVHLQQKSGCVQF